METVRRDGTEIDENRRKIMELYRSPYEAYPFLCDSIEDLRCDFELLTDELASRTGLLRAQIMEKSFRQNSPGTEVLQEELLWLCELIYHMNPTLRTKLTITEEETKQLVEMVKRLETQCAHRCKRFVLTQGCEAACTAHLLRVQGKQLVRLLYRHCEQGHSVPPMLFDLANLLSGYFFFLALKLNELEGVDEVPYVSRNY